MSEGSPKKELDKDELAEFSKKLREYKETGAKNCQGIVKSLLDMKLNLTDLKEHKIGQSLVKITKEEASGDDDKELQELAKKLFTEAKRRSNLESSTINEMKRMDSSASNARSESPSKSLKKQNSEPVKDNKNGIEEEEKNGGKAENKSSSAKDNHVTTASGISIDYLQTEEDEGNEGIVELPKLHPFWRNATVKALSDSILFDFKQNKDKMQKNRKFANKAALQIESAMMKEYEDNDQKYRLESRAIGSFISMTSHSDLRRMLIEGKLNVREFVKNKDNYLNEKLKKQLEKKRKDALSAADTQYDKAIVKESELYQCKKCGSRKIHKEEKQTRSGDEPMTGFFTCMECGKGWRD